MNFKSNVYVQSVRPNIIQDVLSYLKLVNPLYENIEINLANIPTTWINLGCDNDDEESEKEMDIDFVCENSIETINIKYNGNNGNLNSETENQDIDEEEENPLNEYRLPCQETSFVPNIPHELISRTN